MNEEISLITTLIRYLFFFAFLCDILFLLSSSRLGGNIFTPAASNRLQRGEQDIKCKKKDNKNKNNIFILID